MNEYVKRPEQNIIASSYSYDAIVNPESVSPFIKRGLIETLFNIVMRNTAINSKLTIDKLYEMRESLAAFESSTEIVVSEHKDNNEKTVSKKVYKYSKFMSDYNINGWIDITGELIETLAKNEIWYEDILSDGFCCKGKHKNYFRVTHN